MKHNGHRCLNPLSAIFQLIEAIGFTGEGNTDCPEKTTDLPQVTNNEA